MSFYGMLFGKNDNENTNVLWDILCLDDYKLGRFRDIYLREYTTESKECKQNKISPGRYIVLLTRNGGGNRENYEDCFRSLQKHQHYKSDWDCDWDCTYAEIAFSIPTQSKEELDKKEPTKDRGEVFDDIIKAIRNLSDK